MLIIFEDKKDKKEFELIKFNRFLKHKMTEIRMKHVEGKTYVDVNATVE